MKIKCYDCAKEYEMIGGEAKDVYDTPKGMAYVNVDENHQYYSNAIHHCCPSCMVDRAKNNAN